MKYAAALVAPWSTKAKGACLPMGFNQPSQKASAVIKGTLTTTGTGNVGALMWSPALTNDLVFAACTNGVDATATTATIFNDFPIKVAKAATQLPYDTARLATSADLQGRCVAGGIRVRYAGSALNEGGTYVALEEQGHGNNAGKSFETAKTQNAAHTRSILEMQGQWFSCTWSGPVRDRETEYIDAPNQSAPVPQDVNTAFYPIGIYIQSATPGTNFEYEAWYLTEYIGSTVTNPTNDMIVPGEASTLGKRAKTIQSSSSGATSPAEVEGAFSRIVGMSPSTAFMGAGAAFMAGTELMHAAASVTGPLLF